MTLAHRAGLGFLLLLMLMRMVGYAVTCSPPACMLTIDLSMQNGSPSCRMNDKELSPEALEMILVKLGSISQEQVILVKSGQGVSLGRFLGVINMMKKARLRNIAIMAGAPILSIELETASSDVMTFEQASVDHLAKLRQRNIWKRALMLVMGVGLGEDLPFFEMSLSRRGEEKVLTMEKREILPADLDKVLKKLASRKRIPLGLVRVAADVKACDLAKELARLKQAGLMKVCIVPPEAPLFSIEIHPASAEFVHVEEISPFQLEQLKADLKALEEMPAQFDPP